MLPGVSRVVGPAHRSHEAVLAEAPVQTLPHIVHIAHAARSASGILLSSVKTSLSPHMSSHSFNAFRRGTRPDNLRGHPDEAVEVVRGLSVSGGVRRQHQGGDISHSSSQFQAQCKQELLSSSLCSFPDFLVNLPEGQGKREGEPHEALLPSPKSSLHHPHGLNGSRNEKEKKKKKQSFLISTCINLGAAAVGTRHLFRPVTL